MLESVDPMFFTRTKPDQKTTAPVDIQWTNAGDGTVIQKFTGYNSDLDSYLHFTITYLKSPRADCPKATALKLAKSGERAMTW